MAKEAKRGDKVSLNTLRRLFYFQEGEGGITLSAGQTEMAVIPENATERHLDQINHAIKAEQLIIGWPEKQHETLDRDSDIKTLLEGGRNKINTWIDSLRDDKGTKSSFKTVSLEKLIKFEKAGKNRSSVVQYAEKALGVIGGVSIIEESEQEKLEIKLTAGNELEPAVN